MPTQARRLIPRERLDEFSPWSPAGDFARMERRRLLRDLTAPLTGFQMLILVLHYEDDMQFDEIGARLRISESSVWRLHEQICRILAAELGRRGVVSIYQIL